MMGAVISPSHPQASANLCALKPLTHSIEGSNPVADLATKRISFAYWIYWLRRRVAALACQVRHDRMTPSFASCASQKEQFLGGQLLRKFIREAVS